ncbi:MAG: CorA family divalent cation transporter [Mangrovibacterium sp.]
MENGILNALYVDTTNKTSRDISPFPLPDLRNERDYIWLQLNFSMHGTRELLQSLQLNETVIHAMTKPESRPRANAGSDDLLLVLRGINKTRGEKPENSVSIRIFAMRNLIITCQKKNLKSVQDILAEIKNGTPPPSTGDFIVRLNERLVMNMSSTVENIEDRAIAMEEHVLEETGNDGQADLHLIRRQTIQLKRFLIPQRDALNRLQLEKPVWMSLKQQLRLREVSDYLMRYLEVLNTASDLTTVSMDTLSQRQDVQLNQRIYQLSLVASLFLPLGFLTGLFGVNLSGIPMAEKPYAFALFAVLLFLILILLFLLFRRKKWL